MRYRRSDVAGGTYFFTVNLSDRGSNLLLAHTDTLREVINKVKIRHPFTTLAMVVLPEHMHAIWHLPVDDVDYSTRWSLIKSGFSRCLEKTEHVSHSRMTKRERGIWQRRYWEHLIRDENDLIRHVDYIHFNPVKHGLVTTPSEWPHSTIHGYIERGLISADWGSQVDTGVGDCGEP